MLLYSMNPIESIIQQCMEMFEFTINKYKLERNNIYNLTEENKQLQNVIEIERNKGINSNDKMYQSSIY